MPTYKVRETEAGLRLDRFLLGRMPHLTRGEVNRLLQAREVRREGRTAAKGARLRQGQRVEVPGEAGARGPIPQPELPLEVIAETEGMVVLDKPADMACHPLRPGERGTLANALLARYPECADASPEAREAGLVHRLDRSTSGVILAARDRGTHTALRGHFSGGRVNKEYLALVQGSLAGDTEVTASVKPAPGDPTRVVAVDEYLPEPAHEARSVISPVEQVEGYTLVRIQSSTGRRHQVRVHMAHLGHPLAGDTLYGGRELPMFNGAMLHASRVMLPDGEGDFSAPAPWDTVLATLRR